MKKPPARGTYVSRAAFAKLQAERDRLKKDIHSILVRRDHSVITRYLRQFRQMKEINEALKEIAKKELPKLYKKYPDLKLIEERKNEKFSGGRINPSSIPANPNKKNNNQDK